MSHDIGTDFWWFNWWLHFIKDASRIAPTAGPPRRNDDIGSKQACLHGKEHSHIAKSSILQWKVFHLQKSWWCLVGTLLRFLSFCHGNHLQKFHYIHLFLVFTAEIQLLKVTDRIFEAQKLLAKQTVVLFDVCLGTFFSNVSGVFLKHICKLQMKRNIPKGRSQHQRRKFTNFTSKLKLKVHPPFLAAHRLGVATPPTGWRPPDGIMAVCRDDLWKYGRCFSVQEMERCLGYRRLPANGGSVHPFWVKVRQKKRLRWGEHHASFLKISGCVFDGSDLLECVTSRCWLWTAAKEFFQIFVVDISSENPCLTQTPNIPTQLKCSHFRTSLSDAPDLVHWGWLGGFYQSALGLWEDTPMVCNLAWSHSIGFFHSLCWDSDEQKPERRMGLYG